MIAVDCHLSTQAMVNAYTSSCPEPIKNLVIEGPDIVDLSPLNSLVSIDGYLGLGPFSNTYSALANIFQGLTTIEGGIYWAYNDANIETIDGFHNLVTTGDNIDFWNFKKLTTVTGFENLEVCGWSLEFGGNPLLTVLPEFAALTTVNSSIFILENDSLEEITGFNALNYVDWSFQINDNPMLTSICGFNNYFLGLDALGGYTGGGNFAIINNGAALAEASDGSQASIQGCIASCCDANTNRDACNTLDGCFWGNSDCAPTNGNAPGNVCCVGVVTTEAPGCGEKGSGTSCTQDTECMSCNCNKGRGTCK